MPHPDTRSGRPTPAPSPPTQLRPSPLHFLPLPRIETTTNDGPRPTACRPPFRRQADRPRGSGSAPLKVRNGWHLVHLDCERSTYMAPHWSLYLAHSGGTTTAVMRPATRQTTCVEARCEPNCATKARAEASASDAVDNMADAMRGRSYGGYSTDSADRWGEARIRAEDDHLRGRRIRRHSGRGRSGRFGHRSRAGACGGPH